MARLWIRFMYRCSRTLFTGSVFAQSGEVYTTAPAHDILCGDLLVIGRALERLPNSCWEHDLMHVKQKHHGDVTITMLKSS